MPRRREFKSRWRKQMFKINMNLLQNVYGRLLIRWPTVWTLPVALYFLQIFHITYETNLLNFYAELPENRIIQVENGVRIEIRFEHADWLSNSVNIVVGVIDPGVYDNCFAFITTVTPNVSYPLVGMMYYIIGRCCSNFWIIYSVLRFVVRLQYILHYSTLPKLSSLVHCLTSTILYPVHYITLHLVCCIVYSTLY